MFKRVLIANRGEIAVRVARAASALGVESIAVYPQADALSLHLRAATEARALAQTNDPVRAYLDGSGLIAIAKESGCDCVHPGYGFLAENARFAQACADAGLVFIGPDAETIAVGDSETDLPMFRVANRCFAPAQIGCALQARLLGCQISRHSYQRGFLEIARRLAHPDGRQCEHCSDLRQRWPRDSLFLNILEAADRLRWRTLLKGP